MKNQIRLKILGNKKKFSSKLQKILKDSEKKTSKNSQSKSLSGEID